MTILRYHDQPHFITIFVPRCQAMMLFNIEDYIAKKWKNENFEQNACYVPQKKLRTCRIQIQDEKEWFLLNNPSLKNFLIFFLKEIWTEIYFSSIFQNFKNCLNGTYKMFKETKPWNTSSFGVSTEESWGIVYKCVQIVPPPPYVV